MRCKNCKEKFEPYRFLQKYCDKEVCQDIEIKLTLDKVRKVKSKEEKKATKVLKEKQKDKAYYIKKLQIVFNAFIRERDKNEDCISCGAKAGKYKLTAGHFYPTTYQFLRFNEDNVHGQCWYNCNKNKHGNINEYRPRLEAKIGTDRLQWLHHNRHNRLEMSIPELQDKIKEYKLKLKNK